MPITLVPCGWVVCSHHLSSDEIKCFMCPNEHLIQKKNCISTKTIETKYLKYIMENLQNSNDLSQSNYDTILKKIQNRREIVKLLVDEYFDGIVNNVKKNKINCDSIGSTPRYELSELAEKSNLEIFSEKFLSKMNLSLQYNLIQS